MGAPRDLAALSGLGFVVVFGVGSGLWVFDQPASGASAGEIVTFYEEASTRVLVGGSLSLVACVSLVWFGAVLHARIAAAGGQAPAAVAFAGTVLLAAVGFAAETINMAAALRARDEELTPESAQVMFDVTLAFGAQAASVAFAMVALAVGFAALRSGQLVSARSGWFAVTLGTVLLTPAMLDRAAFLGLYALTLAALAALSVHLSRSTSSA